MLIDVAKSIGFRIPKRVIVAGLGPLIKGAWVFLLVAVAARALPIGEFADFSFWLTISIVTGLVFDFGQQTALLARLSKHSKLRSAYVKRKVGMSYATLGLMVAGSVFIAMLLGFSLDQLAAANLAILSAFFGSLGILLCIPSRSLQDYKPDVSVACAELIVALGVTYLLIANGLATGMWILVAYCLARIAGALVRLSSCKLSVSEVFNPRLPRWAQYLTWWPYFVHLLFGTLIINIDLIIGRFVLGEFDYSIYQGGMRTIHAGSLVLTVVGNLLIPKWSSMDTNQSIESTNRSMVRIALVSVGMCSFVILAMIQLGDVIAIALYGSQFESLGRFAPLFALLMTIRLLGAYVGVLLTIRNFQIARTRAAVGGVLVLFLLLVPWAGGYSITFMVVSQIAVHIGMNVYLVLAMRSIWVKRR